MSLAARASAITHMIVVSDLARSKRWYLDVLGCSLYGEYGGTSVVLDWNGTWFLLVTGGGPTADKPEVHLAAPPEPNHTGRSIIFRVADCRATTAALQALGARFLADPVDHGYEIRSFFTDPDGHLFELSELVATGR
ncbi:MAG: catechol 2,3-dioxygenase-like lactoylglutathione lyase family enzyme [Myxococcota bacterium]|jgi:catechol 2,3-dioxygenase-like lactoylglutathione lyase family enzyme